MMQKILSIVNKIKEKAQKGQSMVEYGILITAVIAALVAVKTQFDISADMKKVADAVDNQFTAAQGAVKDTTNP